MSVNARISSLVRRFRSNGHLIARIDPLRGYQARPLNPDEPVVWHSRDDVKDLKAVLESYVEQEKAEKGGGRVGGGGCSRQRMLDLSPFGLEDVPETQLFDVRQWNVDSKMLGGSHATLRELVGFLVDRYCRTCSVEYMHIGIKEQREWLRSRFEDDVSLTSEIASIEEKKRSLKHLIHADILEHFLASRFPSAKKFGIEGCWSLIPGLFEILLTSAKLGVEHFEVGMTHRGRLNVLVNILQKPLRTVLGEFLRGSSSSSQSSSSSSSSSSSFSPSHSSSSSRERFHSGDVQYHLGAFSELDLTEIGGEVGETSGDRKICVSLNPNPSHLESINPVVMGKVRAKQAFLNDTQREKVLGILLHGDASFSGQGVVHETMELSNLDAYTVGGMVHVVINNQIGFTTDPRTGRSSIHPTNVAKGMGVPVFHVNGDCVQSVVKCSQLAAEFRAKFKKDAVINVVCYRKHGHNELDDPFITHPLTYRLIAEQPSTLQLYAKELREEGIEAASEPQILQEKESFLSMCDSELKLAKKYQPTAADLLMSHWQGDAMAELSRHSRPFNQTGVPKWMLKKVGQKATALPTNFAAHSRVEQIFAARNRAIETGKRLDFAFAEALAFGCLMLPFKAGDEAEGKRGTHEELVKRPMEKNAFIAPMVDHPTVSVRLSGQDCERGTFNQRHAAIIDQNTAARYVPLSHISDLQASFDVCNSSLSEEAVLGYEYGYSLENENALVIWEAQFGDFANNAQSMIDNFIASGEDKWLCQSGLVLLLPHGYEGQGPEHSSARLERFLQLVDDDEDRDLSSNSDVKTMLQMFSRLDSDKDGTLSLQEVKSLGMKEMESIVEWQSLKEIRPGTSTTATGGGGAIGSSSLGSGMDDSRVLKSDYIKMMMRWLARNEEAKHNMSVCNVTTPANYFHVLRRQIHRPYAKPLVLMSPKYLLHHAAAVSDIKEFETGTSFDRVISDRSPMNNLRDSFLALDPVPPSQTRKVLVCSGKIAYALHHTRKAKRGRDIVIVRLEQLAPFPAAEMTSVLGRYPNAQIVWVQEEPKNMGGWSYVHPRLSNILRTLIERGERRRGGETLDVVRYVGRAASATTACGSFTIHNKENRMVINDALS